MDPRSHANALATAALFHALEGPDVHALALAIASGANPRSFDEHGAGPCSRAISPQREIYGAPPYGDEDSSLVAAMAELPLCLQALLDAGCDIERSCGPQGNTALRQASVGGSPICLRLLLAAGADPYAANNLGWTASMGKTESFAILAEAGVDLGRATPERPGEAKTITPLQVALIEGHEDTAAFLLAWTERRALAPHAAAPELNTPSLRI